MNELLHPITYRFIAPQFLLQTRAGEQAVADKAYVTAVMDYRTAAEGWIDNHKRLREMSANPEAYVAPPFTRPIPQRLVIEFDVTSSSDRMEYLLPPDPAIQPPALPPYVKPETAPNLGIVSTVAQKEQDEESYKAALFAQVLAIKADVRAIKAKMGIA
jgi:hypothetical protein